MNDNLTSNIGKIHTTELGITRIAKNLSIADTVNVVEWCKEKITSPNAKHVRNGKNWYVYVDGYVLVVNASSYTIITAYM